ACIALLMTLICVLLVDTAAPEIYSLSLHDALPILSMAIRTGAQYIAAIDRMKVDIWVEGKRVEGKISEHPAFRNVIRTQAKLYRSEERRVGKECRDRRQPTHRQKT